MAGSVGGSGDDPEFQVAPMIDVLLVLLIFFMSITTDQILKVDKSISLPVAPDAKKRENDLTNQVVVNIDWNAQENRAFVKFGDELCDPLSMLSEKITPLRAANDKLKVIVRGDGETPAAEIQRVIEQVAAGGVDDISISGVNRR